MAGENIWHITIELQDEDEEVVADFAFCEGGGWGVGGVKPCLKDVSMRVSSCVMKSRQWQAGLVVTFFATGRKSTYGSTAELANCIVGGFFGSVT